MHTYRNNLAQATKILVEEVQRAINTSKEYKYPAFSEPLETAASHPDSLEFTPDESFERISVFVRLDATAGVLDDYAVAVQAARDSLKRHPDKKVTQKDADFWAEIYEGADDTEGLYAATIAVRMQHLGNDSIAPWWPLLDLGNAGTMGGKASHAHPAVAASHFTDDAKDRIESIFNDRYTKKLREVTEEFLATSVDERALAEAVDDMVTNVSIKDLKPGNILGEIELENKNHFLYVTKHKQEVGLLGRRPTARYLGRQ